PFADQADYPPISDPVFDEADQPIMADCVEEPGDVGIQYPVHPPLGDPDRKRVQRIVLTAPGTEPVAEPQEVALPDRIQHLRHGSLDDLVLQRRDAEWPLPPVRLGDVN